MFLHGISGLMLSAAAGYWVFTHAGKEKGRVRTLGQLLGLLIIGASVAGTGLKLYCMATGCPSGKVFAGIRCPYTGGSASQPAK